MCINRQYLDAVWIVNKGVSLWAKQTYSGHFMFRNLKVEVLFLRFKSYCCFILSSKLCVVRPAYRAFHSCEWRIVGEFVGNLTVLLVGTQSS